MRLRLPRGCNSGWRRPRGPPAAHAVLLLLLLPLRAPPQDQSCRPRKDFDGARGLCLLQSVYALVRQPGTTLVKSSLGGALVQEVHPPMYWVVAMASLDRTSTVTRGAHVKQSVTVLGRDASINLCPRHAAAVRVSCVTGGRGTGACPSQHIAVCGSQRRNCGLWGSSGQEHDTRCAAGHEHVVCIIAVKTCLSLRFALVICSTTVQNTQCASLHSPLPLWCARLLLAYGRLRFVQAHTTLESSERKEAQNEEDVINFGCKHRPALAVS